MMHRALLCGALLLCCLAVPAATASSGGITTLTQADLCDECASISLDQPWLYHAGDDSAWADPAFDDTGWELHPPRFPLSDLERGHRSPIGWFRMHVRLDSLMARRALYLFFRQAGASEVYWDGHLVHAMGTVAREAADEQPMTCFYSEPVRLRTGGLQDHVLAVRYSLHRTAAVSRADLPAGFFADLHASENRSLTALTGKDVRILGWSIVAGLCLTLLVLHVIIQLLLPRIPENMDFMLFAGASFMAAVLVLATYILVPLTFEQFAFRSALLRVALIFMPLTGMHFMHAVAGIRRPSPRSQIFFWALLVGGAIVALLAPILLVFTAMLLISAELLRALWIAMRKRVERVWILGIGFSMAILATLLNTLVGFDLLPDGDWVEFTQITSLAVLMVSASAYVGAKFASLNESLETKIEEGRQAVRALAESEGRYRSIVENPIVGVGIVDDHNQIIYVNNRYLEIVRSRREDVVGGDLRKRIVPEHLDEINRRLGRLYRGEVATVTAELEINAGDGSRRTLLASASLYHTRQGKRHMVVHATDITDVRESERKQREAVALAEQTARMASIGVMAGGITHEINQPLNAIMLHAETLQFMAKADRLHQTEPVGTALHHIVLGTERISEIIQHMRSFWLDGPSSAELTPVDLNSPVQQGIHLTEQKIRAHGIELQLELSETPVVVCADKLQLEQIVINLLTNAITALDRHARKGKRITVRTHAEAGEVLLEVTDNGPGLPPIDPDKLFDPFFSTGKEKGGTGLGLAIVKMFVEKFKGRVIAENNAEGGATFCVRLPCEQRMKDEG